MRIKLPNDRWLTFKQVAEHCHIKPTSKRFAEQLAMMVWHGMIKAQFSLAGDRVIVIYHRK